jgi:RHS repeat-associated protein
VGETIYGSTTTFVVDQAGELTQVLADGTNTYLYGNSRIAQVSCPETQYFMGDALGSVRQMVDTIGTETLAKGYEPYGEELSSVGGASSAYGFTGEWIDNSTNLLYLRARYYDPASGRFISKDSWEGNYNQPMSYNKWVYGYDNPVLNTDPSGMDVGCNSDDPSDPRCHHPGDTGGVDWFTPVGEFSTGLVYEYAQGAGGWISPQARAILSASSCESQARLAGRITADAILMYQGVDWMVTGASGMAGGVVACVTGVGCLAGAGAVGVGAGVAGYGATLTYEGLLGIGQNVTYFSQSRSSGGRTLTSDERRQIDRISSVDVDKYIEKHPLALTEPENGPHAIETEQLISRLRNSINTLKRSLPYLDPVSRSGAELAINQGEQKLQILQNWFNRK